MDIGRCFNEALDVYKKNFWTLVLGAALFEILSVGFANNPDRAPSRWLGIDDDQCVTEARQAS